MGLITPLPESEQEPCCAEHCPCCRGECDHPPAFFQPPCHHILALRNLEITDDQFACLITSANARQYRERPLAPEPAHVLTREARVEVLAERQENKLSLWHHDDWLPGDDALDFLGRTVEMSQGNNRALDRGQIVRVGGKHVA